MEKVKKVNFILVILIILLIIGIAVIGIVWGIEKNRKENVIGSETSKSGNSDNQIAQEDIYINYANGIQVSLNNMKDLYESQEGEMYSAVIYGNIVKNNDSSISGLGINSIYIDNNGDLYLSLDISKQFGKKYGNEYKILANATNCGIICSDQTQNTCTIWAIDNKGNVYYKNIEPNSETIVLSKNENLKEIIYANVMAQQISKQLVFVDINGNMYDIDGKILKK